MRDIVLNVDLTIIRGNLEVVKGFDRAAEN
jgi:hypothetical protein